MYFGTIKMMSKHCWSCMHVDDNTESKDTLDVEQNVAERVRPLRIAAIWQQETLCVLEMQEIEWMALDDTEYGNTEDVTCCEILRLELLYLIPQRRMLMMHAIVKTTVNDI